MIRVSRWFSNVEALPGFSDCFFRSCFAWMRFHSRCSKDGSRSIGLSQAVLSLLNGNYVFTRGQFGRLGALSCRSRNGRKVSLSVVDFMTKTSTKFTWRSEEGLI